MKKNVFRVIGFAGIFMAAAVATCAASANPKPLEVGVFAGVGPRSNGCVSWFRLVDSSPEMNLTLLDADDVRSGALDKLDILVMPGGSSPAIKKDLKPEGAEKLKSFIRNGGGYVGTCAGCCLLMEETSDVTRGINVIPYARKGSKGKFLMPVAINEKGAAAMGIKAGEYKINYSAGPVLYPVTNVIEGASFDVWGTFASDFDTPKNNLKMDGMVAIVGGTYGKGRVFAIACHPESYRATQFIVSGAFRYVSGREVTFPTRPRALRALSVGLFSPVIQGTEVAQTIVALDNLPEVDLFPIAAPEINSGMLDHLDWLVLPDGGVKRYADMYKNKNDFIDAYLSRGGRMAGWGEGAKHLPDGGKKCASGKELVEFFKAESSR